MKPAIRTQVDDDQEYWSLTTGLDTGEEGARQEFADEADINKLLERYGVGAATRPVAWGTEVDFDLDLTTARQAIDELILGWDNLPEDVRRQYGTWPRVLEALHAGELKLKSDPEPAKTDTIEDAEKPPE